tara:strand:+ start:58 stop:573 length:516 start_codon:yes stop_codon:yes gene_type:complete
MASRNKEGKSLFFSNVDKPKRRFRDAFKKAIEKGKKTFKGDFSKSVPAGPGQVTAGKLEFSTMKKEDVAKKIARQKRDEARATGKKSKAVYEKATGTKVSSRGQAFAKARKEGRDSFTFEGKRYSTRLKGEKRPATPKISEQAARDGGRIGYKRGGGVGCAKRGFGRALKK